MSRGRSHDSHDSHDRQAGVDRGRDRAGPGGRGRGCPGPVVRWSADGVDLYWTRQGALPLSLGALAEAGGDRVILEDPVTADRYAYRTLSPTAFEVCARFDTETMSADGRQFWRHAAGRQCFEADAEDVERNRRDSGESPSVPEAAPSARMR